MRHGTCFRRHLSAHHAGAAPHSTVAELGVVRRCERVPAMNQLNQIIQWSNANQGFLSGCLTLVYVLATIWLVWLAHRQISLANTLERSRTRPFVLFDLVLDRHFVFATVKNSGQTPALDVRITTTPNVQCLLGGENTHPAQERSTEIAFIARGIAMLAPQRSITALMGHWARVKAAHPQLRFEGTVSYRSADGTAYSEPFVADLSAQDGLLYLGTKTIEDVAKQLEAVARTLDHISTGFHRPLIRTMTQAEYIAEQEASVAEAQRFFEQQQNETPSPPSNA